MMTRPAAVAGLFYPDSAAQLRVEVQRMLASAADNNITLRAVGPPKALIVPHAGYIYSAAVAASAYRLLLGVADQISRVVILGPAHRVHVRGIAVPSADHFATPLGEVPIDLPTVQQLEVFPWVVRSDAAHAMEHCIEVQLPFLQAVLAAFTLVPLVVGDCASPQVGEVIDALWGEAETLLVVSSDLSHYLPYSQAVAQDAATSQAIVERSEQLHGNQACGAYAINGLMRVARARDLSVELLDVRNSGDTAGDKSQVVGYGAYAIY